MRRDDLKLPETRALLSDILGNSFTAVDVEEIPPMPEVEAEQEQTENNSIKFDDLALWALERVE